MHGREQHRSARSRPPVGTAPYGRLVPEIDHLAILRAELETFAGCLDDDLSAPVAHCGDWTLHDLADHVGRGNVWVTIAVTEQRGDGDGDPAPSDRAEVAPWFRRTAHVMLSTLDTDPGTPAWTFYPPHTVGFWQRRRALETVVHRWDAEDALGRPGPIAPALAADGVAEVLEVMVPRQVKGGRALPREHAVRLTATDAGATWTLGPGEPVAGLTAAAADLFLMLWGRVPATASTIRWDGDVPAGLRVLDGPLVP